MEKIFRDVKGKEVWFNTQEQAYFASAIPSEKIKCFQDLQGLIWGRLCQNKYRVKSDYAMLHFTPSTFLFDKIDNLDITEYKYATTIIFFEEYYKMVLQCENLSKSFKENIIYNYYKLREIKFKNYLAPLKMKMHLCY